MPSQNSNLPKNMNHSPIIPFLAACLLCCTPFAALAQDDDADSEAIETVQERTVKARKQ